MTEVTIEGMRIEGVTKVEIESRIDWSYVEFSIEADKLTFDKSYSGLNGNKEEFIVGWEMNNVKITGRADKATMQRK